MNTTELAPRTLSTVDPDLAAMMDGVFSDYRQTAPPASPGERIEYDRTLWQRLNSLGLVRLTGAEESGGSGAGWLEAAELLSAAVRHGVRIPLAEHDLLACWLLETLGRPVDDAARTVYVAPRSGESTKPVPWAADAERVVVLWPTGDEYRLTEFDTAELSVALGTNLIGEPRDTVSVDTAGVSGHPVTTGLVDQLSRKSAMIRAIQVCAALDRAVALSIEHVASRIQFGRPLAKFQAIQNLISDAAAESALARAATEAALHTAIGTDWQSAQLDFQIATARSCAGHAASVVTRNAHQVHGAIGTTHEHRLHEFTRAALAWRSEFGSVRFWDDQVAAAAVAAGGQQLWALIAGS
ncbi:acyl-CoA/acyl-ACP dehydrogenase [Mycolicibacterium septicum]|uniref:acyl-CoA dehydrogenase family protein n=1 Tax=Mycolicibacterium septicum TaxID=98668 RepID=UPI0023E16C4E|nr:acyl-CoA dehydrogenase family protein [Mycolicibacterium septicum]MDF3337535.1 acyl-CoA/acyl-ACP dehydrogenase [Mycolicibacterium septicum]